MKDKTKEIIDYLGNDKNYNCDNNDGSYYLELPYREAHELKDYITNLQEKVKLLTTGLEATDKAYKNYKSRNKKAIEYGKELRLFDNESLEFEIGTNFISILQGDDKDVKD